MLESFLPAAHIRLREKVGGWREAVSLSARPLVEGGFITPGYVQAVFAAYEANGAYFVIAPGIAMPHARPEDGVIRQGLALLLLKEGVDFGCENDPVRIIVTLCATDSHSHVQMLSALANMLGGDETVAALLRAECVADVVELVKVF